MKSTPYIADRTTAQWQELDRQHYLHPFTDYKNLHAKGSRVIVKAEGVYLYDSEGNRMLDGSLGQQSFAEAMVETARSAHARDVFRRDEAVACVDEPELGD